MIKVKSFVFNPFMENTYIAFDDQTNEGIIIDPGCYEKEEKEELTAFIATNQIKIVKLLNTHCHIDHVFGNQFIKDQYQVPLMIHKADEATLNAVKAYAPNYGFTQYEEAQPDSYIDEGDTIAFGEATLEIIFVPGHAPGHVAFYHKEQKICFGGDVLFDGSIGRTDLPGGDFDTLIQSIHRKMFLLSDDTEVYCGHGPSTTIGKEKATNPFCAISQS